MVMLPWLCFILNYMLYWMTGTQKYMTVKQEYMIRIQPNKSTFRITVIEKRVLNIVVLNIAVGNKSCKNKMVIRNNAHGSYFI